MPSKFHKASLTEEATALYSDSNVHTLANLVIRQVGDTDRSRHFTCFMLDIEARVYGNRQAAERANRNTAVWKLKRRLVLDYTGEDLLEAVPPSANTVRKWRNRLLPETEVDPHNDVLPSFLSEFLDVYTVLAVRRAVEMGNFAPGKTRDFTKGRARHTVIADGTYISPWSKAQVWTDTNGVKRALYSRAKSPGLARTQHYSNVSKDNRVFMGVNQTAALTVTKYGRVHLGLTRAMRGGEPAAITRVMDQIMACAGDGVHTLTFDKGISGWPENYLLAAYGVLVRTPPKLLSSVDPESNILTLDAKAAIRLAHGGTVTRQKDALNARASALTASELNQRYKVELVAKQRDGESIGAGLAVGVSQYLNSAGNVEQSRSIHHHYDTYAHPLPDGTNCTHELYVDHTALWDTEATPHGIIKTARLRCTGSTAVREGRHYELRSTHTLVCPHTGEVLALEPVRYSPSPDRGPGKTRPQAPAEKAASALRPVAECDPTWRKVYSPRNNIESWFSFLKARLNQDRQAASLNLNHQFLDTLYVGLISNALALRQYRLHIGGKN